MINKNLRIVLIAAVFGFMASPAFSQGRLASEASYVEAWCAQYAGQVEVRQADRTRVDCITYYHAIEFDFANKWAEAIGQSLHYAIMTDLRAGIVFIVERPEDMRYIERAKNIIARYSLPIDLWVTGP